MKKYFLLIGFLYLFLLLPSCNDKLNDIEFTNTENSGTSQVVVQGDANQPSGNTTSIDISTPSIIEEPQTTAQQPITAIGQTPISEFIADFQTKTLGNPCENLEPAFDGIVNMTLTENLPTTNKDSVTGIIIKGSGRDITMSWNISQTEFPNLLYIELTATGENNKLTLQTDLNSDGLLVIGGTGTNVELNATTTFSPSFQLKATGDSRYNINLGTVSNASKDPTVSICQTGQSNAKVKISSVVGSSIGMTGDSKLELETNGFVTRTALISNSQLRLKLNNPSNCPVHSKIICL